VRVIGWKLFIVDRDHTLSVYTTNIFHIRDVLHENDNINITLMHVLKE